MSHTSSISTNGACGSSGHSFSSYRWGSVALVVTGAVGDGWEQGGCFYLVPGAAADGDRDVPLGARA